jgi:hypothetical protein
MSPSYKQPEVKTNLTSFLCGIRSGHPKHIIGQNKKQTKKMRNTEPLIKSLCELMMQLDHLHLLYSLDVARVREMYCNHQDPVLHKHGPKQDNLVAQYG